MIRSTLRKSTFCLLVLFICSMAFADTPSIVIRNNHDFAYRGPVEFSTKAPDGLYRANASKPAGFGESAQVIDGKARVLVSLAPHAQIKLYKTKENMVIPPVRESSSPVPVTFALKSDKVAATIVEYGFAVIPGKDASADAAIAAFKPIEAVYGRDSTGRLSGEMTSGHYNIRVTASIYEDTHFDVETTFTRTKSSTDDAYVALIRRVKCPGASNVRMRFNSIFVNSANEPQITDRTAAFAHGLDWCSWKREGMSFMTANSFTPGPTILSKANRWTCTSPFYIQEKIRQKDDYLYFISEIACYTQPQVNEPVKLRSRFAVSAANPPNDWEESQFIAFAGYRAVTEEPGKTIVDIGVPYVEFGTSYFPYSTMTENFDYYRTAGLDREGWWPFSPVMWEKWKAFIPQMQTDLRIIRAMGFDWVRLHHLELLGEMDRANALSFLDWYMSECRKLGLKVMIDTSGSPEWMAMLASRYKDVVKMIEMDNEVLIPGIKKEEPARWTACYNAIKKAAPQMQVFLTGNCNQGIFNRLCELGVPFDRVGYHFYKHRAGNEEIEQSVALAVACHAAELGKRPVLGEYNWKFLTHLTPEARAKEFALIYSSMLKPRAIPHFFQFHWQETLCVNPRLSRQGLRHYETIHLDRRPKLEAIEFMKLINRYCRPDSPLRELPIQIQEVTIKDGKARARFTVTNATKKPVTVYLATESYGGITANISSLRTVKLRPGAQTLGSVQLTLAPDAKPGAYHYFIKAGYSGKAAYGWGTASNPGAPTFDKEPVLADAVDYPQGPGIVEKIDWDRPVCIAFGEGAPILEMEMAYLVFNTLQSATGRTMRLCSTADIPKDFSQNGTLILVGAPQTNPLVAQASVTIPADKGLIDISKDGKQLLLTGQATEKVEAAATDFVLRYWKNARDSSCRISGLDKGAALGNRAAPGQVNPP